MKPKNEESYLQGEMNACEALGKAVAESADAMNNRFKGEDKLFVLRECQGILLRATQLISKKNKEIGIENPDKGIQVNS